MIQIKKQSRKEVLESIYRLVFYGEFLNKEVEGKLVKRLFEDESNEQLLDILEAYKRHNNYLDLKNQIYIFLETSVPEY